MTSVYLLKKYIRNMLTEISINKRVPGNPAWEEYNAFKANRDNNTQGLSGFNLYNKRGREGKKWFNKHADQNWLNGPVENIIILHNPVAFSVKQYKSYEECRREILRQYKPGVINKNEMSAIGIINRDADTIDTDTCIREMLNEELNPEVLGIDLDKTIFLHLSPRRITQAAANDSYTNTYNKYPTQKPIGFSEWNKLTPKQFSYKYQNYLDPKDIRFLNNSEFDEYENEDEGEGEYMSFEDIKNKYKHLRTNIENYNYDQSFKSSGARKWPQVYSSSNQMDDESSDENHMSILDLDDFDDLMNDRQEIFGLDDEVKNLYGVLGEVVVGNWKIESAYINSRNLYYEDESAKEEFEMWYNEELTDQDIIEKYNIDDKYNEFNYLQLFYRIKVFIDAGVKINWF